MDSDMMKKMDFYDRISLRIPEEFEAMDAQQAETMFPYPERPEIILKDKDTERFCTLQLIKEQKLFHAQVKRVIQTISKVILSLHPSSLLLESQIMELDKRNCGWFEYWTNAAEGKLHNYMYIYPVDEKMLLGTMGCRLEDEEGEALMMEIMKSLEFIDDRRIYSGGRL